MDTRKIELPDGAQLMTYHQGDGRPVLLISGLGGTAAFWRPFFEKQNHVWHMMALDQRGIGASTRGTAALTIAQLADDCLKILDAYAVENCIVIGHSTGGAIAQYLAAHQPQRVKGLVLSGSWLEPHPYIRALFEQRLALLNKDPKAYNAFGALMGYSPDWLCKNWDVYENALLASPVNGMQIKIISERIKALLDFDGRLLAQKLKMPTLVMGAKDDFIIPSFLQENLSAALQNSRCRILESGGHFFPVTRIGQSLEVISKFMHEID
jgi:aminoacrylate hydrolase